MLKKRQRKRKGKRLKRRQRKQKRRKRKKRKLQQRKLRRKRRILKLKNLTLVNHQLKNLQIFLSVRKTFAKQLQQMISMLNKLQMSSLGRLMLERKRSQQRNKHAMLKMLKILNLKLSQRLNLVLILYLMLRKKTLAKQMRLMTSMSIKQQTICIKRSVMVSKNLLQRKKKVVPLMLMLMEIAQIESTLSHHQASFSKQIT